MAVSGRKDVRKEVRYINEERNHLSLQLNKFNKLLLKMNSTFFGTDYNNLDF